MPCLRCGCPWWLGEDWDARCARCGWDCEDGGYDDDSQPLPKYAAKWAAFTSLIREGRTAPWDGPVNNARRPRGGGGKAKSGGKKGGGGGGRGRR